MQPEEANPHLAEYARSRSEHAFRRLVEGYGGLVLGIARQRLGVHSAWAEDVAQTTFIALASQAASIPDATHLASWLHRVTCRTAIDRIRTEARRQRREESFLMNPPSESAPDPQLGAAVDDALDSLPAGDRRLLSLRFLDGLGPAATARALGLSEDACRMRISRALDRLRGKLAARGVASSATLLARTLAATPAGTAIPPGLAAQWSVTALSSSSASAPFLLIPLMTSKLKIAAIATLVAFLIPVVIALRQQSGDRAVDPGAFGDAARSRTLSALRPNPATASRRIRDVPAGMTRADFDTWFRDAIQTCRENPDLHPDELIGRLMAGLDRPAPDLLKLGLGDLSGIDDARVRMLMASALLGSWAGRDGLGAMSWAQDHLTDQTWIHPLATPFRVWSDRDPEGAIAWLADASNTEVLGRSFGNQSVSYYLPESLVKPLIAAGRFDQIGRLAVIPGVAEQLPFILAEQLRNAGDAQAIYQGLNQLPDGQRQAVSAPLAKVLAELAPESSEALKHWVETMPDPSERASAGASLAERWVATAGFAISTGNDSLEFPPPAEVAQWALANTPPAGQAALIESMIREWIRYPGADNTRTAGEWLATRSGDAAADSARSLLARHLALDDAAGARQWAGEIQDAGLRRESLEIVTGLSTDPVPTPGEMQDYQTIEAQWRSEPDQARLKAAAIRNAWLRRETQRRIQQLEDAPR